MAPTQRPVSGTGKESRHRRRGAFSVQRLIQIYSCKKLTIYFTFWNISQVSTVSPMHTGTVVTFNICLGQTVYGYRKSPQLHNNAVWKCIESTEASQFQKQKIKTRFSPCGPVISSNSQLNVSQIKKTPWTSIFLSYFVWLKIKFH